MQCRICNQLGHMQRVCKNKPGQSQQVQVVEQHDEEHEEKLFVVTHVESALVVQKA